MMHVLFRDSRHDRQYLDEMASGWEALRDRVMNDYSPERVAPICRLPVETIESLAHRYGTTGPTFIRLNYGLQRHAGGGTAVRTIALLPAITGAWNEAGGGAQLSSSGTYGFNMTAPERPDFVPPGTPSIHIVPLGRAPTVPNDPPRT